MLLKRFVLLAFAIFVGNIALLAQLEVKEGSFKEVTGFININTEKMYDDNDKPYAVLKIRTENINAKQRRELEFKGDARTFFETEYKDGEVWLYISHYASFLKISHPDLSSTEFWFPFDMEPKKGYELTLVNLSESNINEEQIMSRLDELENATKEIATAKAEPQEAPDRGYNFLAFNVSYNNYSQLAYGFTIGGLNRFGWFASAMSNFSFKGFSTDLECGDDFLVDGEAFQYSGTKHYTSLSVTVGAMCRVFKPMSLKLGAGYGLRTLAYETTGGELVKNTDQSAAGLEVLAGVQFKVGEIVLSLDCVTTAFKYYEARLGIGLGPKR